MPSEDTRIGADWAAQERNERALMSFDSSISAVLAQRVALGDHNAALRAVAACFLGAGLEA